MAPRLQCVVALGHWAMKKDEIIWHWWRPTMESVLSLMKLIKSSDAAWSLILGPAPDWAYCSRLFSYYSPLWPLPTVTGGLPGEALISVSLSFSISHPRVGESSLGQGWTEEELNGRAHGSRTISSVWCSRRLGVCGHTLVCATCLTPDTVTNQSAVPLQLYLLNKAPYLCWWDHGYCWHLNIVI